MSILIKNMVLPRSCVTCPLAHWNKVDELTGCEIVIGKKHVPKEDKEFWASAERPEWCPLIGMEPEQALIMDERHCHECAWRSQCANARPACFKPIWEATYINTGASAVDCAIKRKCGGVNED